MTDEMTRNSESQMLSQLVKWMKRNLPEIKVLFTWAYGMLGKVGYVYQASNFIYAGYSGGEIYMRDGVKLHVRQMKSFLVLEGKKDSRITVIVAMFMGCTFNAMNIISEKEDGVAFVNEILPITPSQYIFQKVVIGFLFGCLSSIVTACICFQLSWQTAGGMLALIVLSSFVAALIGLFVGKFSDGLMIGVVYIKIVMLLFLAVPLVCALIGVNGPIADLLPCSIPASF